MTRDAVTKLWVQGFGEPTVTDLGLGRVDVSLRFRGLGIKFQVRFYGLGSEHKV